MAKLQAQRTTPSSAHAISERLRFVRQEIGLTLAEVGERTGVSISNLSKIERGEV
jgi:Helix-turn-helix.